MNKKLIISYLLSLLLLSLTGVSLISYASEPSRKEVMLISQYPNLINETLNPDTTETYNSTSRNFQRMATVIQAGKRIYAAWTSGGDTEPHPDNYIVVAYSDDEGQTWVDPYMIIDPLDYESGDKAQLPNFWFNPDGLLFLFYSCKVSGYRYIISNNPDEENINDVVWSSPKASNSGGGYTKPTILSNGTCLFTTQGSNLVSNPVYASFNKGVTWEKISETTSSAGSSKRFNESRIVELSDGSLMYLGRLENPTSTGGIEQSFSYDGGYTWSESTYNLPYPLRGAGSRFYFGKLSSGNLVFVTNNSKDTVRRNLTIYLSTDDGVTWPYSLLIDDRYPVSYPDLAEGDNGKLAIIYDAGGNVGSNEFGLCEIRMALITEADILANKVYSEGSYLKGIVNKADEGIEIAGVTQELESKRIVNLGTPKADILTTLPLSVSVTLENNETYSFEGIWKTEDYNSNIPGKYTFYFESTSWDKKMFQDNYSYLKIYVTVLDEESGCGCVSNETYILMMEITLLIIGISVRRKR